MSTTKKVMNIALKIAVWVWVAFAVFMMVFTVFTVATVDHNERDIFGIKFYIVRTDSMSKSELNAHMDVHFKAGDIIVVKNVKDPKNLADGTIISFMSTNSDNYGETVTHMIRRSEFDEKGNLLGYVTFGTNKGDDDEALVGPEYILGEYVCKLPGVGQFFAFVKSTKGYIVCILVPFLLLILYNGFVVVRLFRKYKREQMEELQAERDQINAERAENQRMLQELMALKAQLDQKESGEGTPPIAPASEEPSVEEKTDEDQ